MTATVQGILSWSASENQDGHKDYHIVLEVESALNDGPDAILNAAGMPAIGAPYQGSSLPMVANGGSPSIINDFNPWAFRWPNCEVKIHSEKSGENTKWYEADILFSTRPLERCMTALPANPISEPPKIGGSFTKFTREALVDRYGYPILNSALEPITGQQVERDYNTASVTIEMNFATFGGGTWAPMIDTLNDSTLWGLPPRCVKLSNVRWQRKLYSLCTFFYNFTYEFDINFETFDRLLPDIGTKILAPGGNVFNPSHFVAYQDLQGNTGTVTLDGSGNQWTGISSGVVIVGFSVSTNSLISTAAPHNLSIGDQCIIVGTGGTVNLNGTWEVTDTPTSNEIIIDNPFVPSATLSAASQLGSFANSTLPGSNYVQFYDESNFLLLGIPSSL
jgi:hypothetical protein